MSASFVFFISPFFARNQTGNIDLEIFIGTVFHKLFLTKKPLPYRTYETVGYLAKGRVIKKAVSANLRLMMFNGSIQTVKRLSAYE
jgi:hypothetical protein